MGKPHHQLPNYAAAFIAFLAILVSQAHAFTDPFDVAALQDLYGALGRPPQLKGWDSLTGDPCDELWTGVFCSGSSVIYLNLRGLNLTGYLGSQLFNLHNLKQLDVSSNNIQGEIPYGLPANATFINLACNNLEQSIPHSLTSIKNLRRLNISRNSLSGPIGNVFTALEHLKEMDLSYNNFTGDLPSSFGDLTNLTKLFLQNNKFTGSVIFLAELPLSDLNIQDNFFSGVIPTHFQTIRNLWMGGNKFHTGGNYPPWDFPVETMPAEQNISSPPTSESSAIESYPPKKKVGGTLRNRKLGPGGIACVVVGGTLLISCVGLVFAIRINHARAQRLKKVERNNCSSYSLPVSTIGGCSSDPGQASPQLLPLRSPPMLGPRRLPPIWQTRPENVNRRRSFSKKSRISTSAKLYTVAELQSATNSFREKNLLGEGSLGSVYKAEFAEGQMFVVKSIHTVPLSLHEEEKFMDVVWSAARLRHPNIVTLVGYCMEHGQHLLVYEYVRSVSLDDALHSGQVYKPLPWAIRLQIAIGIARALDYLHSAFSPPIAHSNLKAANILLDEELMPRICDCGLAILRPLTSNSVKLKASEMAIGNSGYIAPEHGQPGIDNTKCDVYAYGVLLLELLTGRLPFDSSRPREEQYLAKWASSQLHDSESLEQMLDSSMKPTLSSKVLSQFADIISLCIQPEKEFRPPMAEIVESLKSLVQKPSGASRSTIADETELEPHEKSFRSTASRFKGSPTFSVMSI